jgi:two-component system CheB/CheR fusion protein
MTETQLKRSKPAAVTYVNGNLKRLKKQLVYYQAITETIREPFLILDKNLFVVTANATFYDKFNVHKKDTERRLIYELGDNQWDAPELRELLENILPKHRVFNDFEVTHNFPSLGIRTMLVNARQIDHKQLILVAMEDVTLAKKLKADADELTANLIKQRNQLKSLNDAKDDFISLASHQLRTPATVVKQYMGMLTHEYAGKVPEEQMNLLNIVSGSNDRQLEIIEDLLKVAKVDAGKVYLEKALCDVVEQAEAAIQAQTIFYREREQNIILHKTSDRIMAFIDPKLMLMVLENLLDNAGKYSKHGAQVTVNIDQDSSFTTVSITDQGVGIYKSDLKKLFKKFSRIDNPLSVSVKGTGLGLYWVKKILDLHGGSIKVKSTPSVGSTFIVKVPNDDEHSVNQLSTSSVVGLGDV